VGQEADLGRLGFEEMLQQAGGKLTDVSLITYVNNVAQKLTRQSKATNIHFQITIINDSIPNAFSLPGGDIALSRGLLAPLSNEAQLAALLSHEMGHVIARHSGSRVKMRRDPASFVDERNSNGRYNLFDQPYSTDQEREADQIGIDLMADAGYAPLSAAQVEEDAYLAAQQGVDPQELNGLLFVHPLSARRTLENRLYIQQKKPETFGGVAVEAEFSLAFNGLTNSREGYNNFDQARKLERLGEIAEAIKLYHQALMEVPDEPLILCSLGLAYLRNEDLVPARRYLIKAVNFQPDYYQSHLGLGYIYQQKQQYWQALEELEAGYTLLPTLEGGYLLAEVREQVGDKKGARRLYTAVIQADTAGKLGLSAAARLRQLGN